MIGMGTRGAMNEFLTNGCDRTGIAGTMIDTGKGMELGASRTIDLDQRARERNLDTRGKWNIIRGLRSCGMSKKDEELGSSGMSQKGEDLRSSGMSSRENLTVRSSNSRNNIRVRSSNSRNKNHKTLSLKENLKEGRGNIECRMTKSLKKLLSIISVG